MHTIPLIPYFQTTRYRVQAMIELAQIKQGELCADLGSGDGRIVIALAQAGAMAHGFEINTQMVTTSQENIKTCGLSQQIVIHHTDFWKEDLSQFSVITMYPMPQVMDVLQKKLWKELAPHARVLLNYYPFTTWKESKKKDNVYLYIR